MKGSSGVYGKESRAYSGNTRCEVIRIRKWNLHTKIAGKTRIMCVCASDSGKKKTRERRTVVELGELQDQLVDIMWYIADDSGGRCEDKKNRDRQR